MKEVAYWSLCSAAVLVVALVVGCGGGQAEDSFEGIHVFEGRVSETGGSYALHIGDVEYALEGNTAELGKFTGQTVQVTASIEGNTLRVTRVGSAAAPPPEGN
jgi:hypothetical protein